MEKGIFTIDTGVVNHHKGVSKYFIHNVGVRPITMVEVTSKLGGSRYTEEHIDISPKYDMFGRTLTVYRGTKSAIARFLLHTEDSQLF